MIDRSWVLQCPNYLQYELWETCSRKVYSIGGVKKYPCELSTCIGGRQGLYAMRRSLWACHRHIQSPHCEMICVMGIQVSSVKLSISHSGRKYPYPVKPSILESFLWVSVDRLFTSVVLISFNLNLIVCLIYVFHKYHFVIIAWFVSTNTGLHVELKQTVHCS